MATLAQRALAAAAAAALVAVAERDQQANDRERPLLPPPSRETTRRAWHDAGVCCVCMQPTHDKRTNDERALHNASGLVPIRDVNTGAKP